MLGLLLLDPDVFELPRLAVDADLRNRDPRRELAALEARPHQAGDEITVVLGGQPIVLVPRPFRFAQQLSVGRSLDVLELTDIAMEGDVGELEPEIDAGFLDDLVPAVDTPRAVRDIIVAQPHVDRRERRLLDYPDLTVDELAHRIGRGGELVVVLDLRLLEPALEAGVVVVRR